MMRKKPENPFNWQTALVFSLTISLIVNFITLLTVAEVRKLIVCNIINQENVDFISYGAILMRFGMHVLTLFILYMYNFKLVNSPLSKAKKRIFILLGTLVITSILSFIFQYGMRFTLNPEIILQGRQFLLTFIKDLIVTITVLLSILLLYLADQREKTLVENEKLVAENIRNRYEALKNQINPHFLFNSLNTLNGLIGYDDHRAHKYVEKLSSVFRYIIQNKEVIKLNEELDFVDSYSYLMKIRYGENLQIQTVIDKKYIECYIVPISLQLLVENAIKHNVISNKYPLVIKIDTTSSYTIVVENSIQAKSIPPASTGIGLANLVERYELLSQKEVVITNANGVFRVEIPLIFPKELALTN